MSGTDFSMSFDAYFRPVARTTVELRNKGRYSERLWEFFPCQDRKIPGNSEMPKVFPARKRLISDITAFPAGTGINL
jgi:hypothetical protein